MTSSPFAAGRPIAIAHRGSRLLWPENTMTAFSGAASHGCSFFETDVRVTADGVLVCFHDPELDRTTNGGGSIVSSSWSQIAELDAGYNHRLGDQFPFRGRGVTVPRFEELARSYPEAGLVVDLKADGSVEPLARTIFELMLTDRVIVGSFAEERLARFRAISGDQVATSTSSRDTIKAIIAGSLRGILSGPASALQVPPTWYGIPVVTPRLVKSAHAAGKLIHVWTINRRDEMQQLLDLGVDGLITDRLDLLAPFLF